MLCKRKLTGSVAAAAMLVALAGCGGAKSARSGPATADQPPLTSATETTSQPTAPPTAAPNGPGPAPTTAPAGGTANAQPAAPATQPASQPAAPASPPASQPAQQQPAAPAKPTPPAVPTPPSTAPQSSTVSFTTIARGQQSGVDARSAVLIQDEARLKAQGIRPQQAVDFNRESVVAVYMGEQKTGGYSVEITSVKLEGGKLVVTVKQNRPSPGAMVTQALTQPYHAVKIPKVPAGTTLTVNWN